MKINVQKFLNENRGVIQEPILGKLLKSVLNGVEEIEISDDDYNRTLFLKQEQKKRDEALFRCVRLNNEGTAYEKEGKIDDAIKCYEQNIGKGTYPACHSYNRLMVIYRKRKDYDNEIRVIDEAMEYLCETYDVLKAKYEDRKQKVLALKGRQ